MKFGLANTEPSKRILIIFLLKLIIIYCILDLCFYGYVGILDPKGSYDFSSTWIGRYNLITAITTATTYPVSWLLEMIGYSTFVTNDIVGVKGFIGIKVLFPCLGIKMWIAFFSLIMAYPTLNNWKRKCLYIIIGIAIIHCFNIIRMLLLTLTNKYYGQSPLHEKIFQRHHDAFNLVVGGVVLLMFYMWVRWFNNRSKNDL